MGMGILGGSPTTDQKEETQPNTNWGGIISGVGSAAGSLLGLGLDNTRQKQQYQNQVDLMNLQLGNQMKLNKQAQEISQENWDYTNYENQKKHMENAGLNVGLMYGSAGQGGQSTSASGGSASGGQAPTIGNQNAVMGMQLAQQMALLRAQTENVNADTKLKEVDAAKKAGVETDNLKEDTNLKNTQSIGQQLTNAYNSGNMQNALKLSEELVNQKQLENNKLISEGKKSKIEADYEERQQIAELNNKNANTILTKAQSELTNQQEKESIERIRQNWRDLELKNKGLNIQEQQANIQQFAQETQRNYPNIMNVSGGILNDWLKSLYGIFGIEKENTTTFSKVK